MKAPPMSRNVTQVTSHSPSQSSTERLSSSGWPARLISGRGRSPQSTRSKASDTAIIP
jgi:hypothetical protein